MNNVTYFLYVIILVMGSSCATTKYIPNSYFQTRHAINIAVKPLPAPSHEEKDDSLDRGLLGMLVKDVVQSSRAKDIEKVFATIKTEEMQTELHDKITSRIRDYYDIGSDEKDLRASIKITSWGWILPTASFGIRIGSYQLQISGTVTVYDMKGPNKEIAYTTFTSQEQMKDYMDVKETELKVKKVVDEFAELCAEFLWRSSEDEK